MVPAFISAALAIAAHITAVYHMAEHRFSKKMTLAIWLVYGAMVTAFWLYLNAKKASAHSLIFAYYAGMLLWASLYFATTRGRLGQRAFLLITYIVLFSVFGGVRDIFRYSVFSSPMCWQSLAVNALLLALLLWLFLSKLLPQVRAVGRQIDDWRPLCGISALLFAAATCLTIWPYSMTEATDRDIFSYLTFVLVVSMVYPVLFGNLQKMAQISRAKQTELHRDLLLSQVEGQRLQTEAARRSRHDLRHHDLMIAEFAQNGDLEGLLCYLGQYESAAGKQPQPHYCENETLSHILAVYLRRAELAGIKVCAQAQARRSLPVLQPDLVAIVANLLENAIHGCEKSGAAEPFLRLSIHEKSDKLVIFCENSCRLNLHCFDRLPESLRGIGIASMEEACSRYSGICDFKAAGGIFTCGIILDLSGQG